MFALIQFTCLAAGGHITTEEGERMCVLKNGRGPCGFLIFLGVLAFLDCMVFLAIDAVFDNWSNIKHRKYAVLADLGFSGMVYPLSHYEEHISVCASQAPLFLSFCRCP